MASRTCVFGEANLLRKDVDGGVFGFLDIAAVAAHGRRPGTRHDWRDQVNLVLWDPMRIFEGSGISREMMTFRERAVEDTSTWTTNQRPTCSSEMQHEELEKKSKSLSWSNLLPFDHQIAEVAVAERGRQLRMVPFVRGSHKPKTKTRVVECPAPSPLQASRG